MKEQVDGMYGSKVNKSKACGFCKLHKKHLTVRTVKEHKCLSKQCRYLVKYVEHDWWREREKAKQIRKARKQAIRDMIGE